MKTEGKRKIDIRICFYMNLIRFHRICSAYMPSITTAAERQKLVDGRMSGAAMQHAIKFKIR